VSIEKLNYVWPKWEVVEQLGEGSFGKVYKVVRTEHTLISYAAVKVISIPQNKAELESMRAEGLSDSGTRSYFEGIVTDCVNEIKLMESMKGNTNVVSVEDYKVLEKKEGVGWDIFIRMELLTSLNSYIADKQLSEAEVIKIGQDVCAALYLCSQLNVIHRDIKPENIFVSPFGDFKVGDFGIAREMEVAGGSLSQKGTYNYMAPEVVASRRYDATVDIYSLGLVLYKLLNNNRMPFLDPYTQLIQYQDRKIAVDRRLSGEALPNPVNASPYMAQVIHKACAFDPSDRFQTPYDFREALGATGGEMPARAPRQKLDETTAVRRSPHVAPPSKSLPRENKRNERTAAFGKKKKSKAKRVLVPICLFFIVAGVFVGFIMNQREDIGESSGNEISYDMDADARIGEAEGVLNSPELQVIRLMDVSRHSSGNRTEWIVDTSLLPRKVDESASANNAYTNGLRLMASRGFRNTGLRWDDTYSYLSFDVGVVGNGGATVRIEGQPTGAGPILWERTIPPGQILSVRNLNVSEFEGFRIGVRSANDQDDIVAWVLDPVVSMTEIIGGSAHDDIMQMVVEASPTPPPTDAPTPTDTPTPLPTESTPDVELLVEQDDELELNDVCLSTVEVIASSSYRISEQLFIGSSGHRYHRSFIFSPSTLRSYFESSFSYVTFNLDNNYTTFFAEIVLPFDQNERFNYEFLIEISFDDIAEPVLTIEDFNIEMAPMPIELDVSGVTNMYVVIRGRGTTLGGAGFDSNNEIRFVNATLRTSN